MVVTRHSLTKATPLLTAAALFANRGSHGPWNTNYMGYAAKTIGAIAAALASLGYGGYKGAQILSKMGPRSYPYRRKRFARKRKMSYMRRRRSRRKLYTGKGPYQRRGRPVIGRRLNSKVTRNDYDSTRELVRRDPIFPTSTAIETARTSIAVYDFNLALSKLFDFDEYKVTNIQMVLTPVNVNTGETNLEVNDAGDPYLYVIPAIHPESWSSTPNLNVVRATPGVMRFHYLCKKFIVINFKPLVPFVCDVIGSFLGLFYEIQEPMKYLNWLHNPQTAGPPIATNYPKFGHVQFYMP